MVDQLPESIAHPSRKVKRNPLVLVGALATAGVLVAGMVSFHKGNQGMSQAMMRTRVLFQGATVGLMLATGGYQMLTMPKVLQKGRE